MTFDFTDEEKASFLEMDVAAGLALDYPKVFTAVTVAAPGSTEAFHCYRVSVFVGEHSAGVNIPKEEVDKAWDETNGMQKEQWDKLYHEVLKPIKEIL